LIHKAQKANAIRETERDGALFEIKSALILQPGPAALTDGLDQLVRIVADWASSSAAR